MRNIVIILSILTGFAASSFGQSKSNKLEETQIKTSAVCNMCKSSIEKAMAFEKGVKKANLDKASQVLTVSFDPRKTDKEKIKKAIIAIGYDADDMQADPKAYDRLNECCKKDMGVH
jgi:periplasmic mercuric ion binding protein